MGRKTAKARNNSGARGAVIVDEPEERVEEMMNANRPENMFLSQGITSEKYLQINNELSQLSFIFINNTL